MNTQLSALLKPRDSDEESNAENLQSTENPRTIKVKASDWRSRFASALPWLLVLGFLGLLAAVLGTRLLPARELTIASVVTVRQSVDAVSNLKTETDSPPPVSTSISVDAQFEAPMLFQASGWVEPDPYATKATALVGGVIETVDVLEGDLVKKGQLLATLIDDDARLDVETAKSKVAALHAQCDSHLLQIDVVKAQIASLSKQVAVAEAQRDETADLVQRLQKVSSGGVSERDIAKAGLELATKNAEVEALAVTEAELNAKVNQLKKIEADFTARIAEAKTDVSRKQLALDRTRIESPIEGRVLRLLAAPGQKRMLNMDQVDSATIAILYDPKQLQARIDVPLAEAAQLAIGQPVRLRSELLPGKTFRGRVTRIVGEADLQRNTLQAKVEIEEPDDRMRPEMLCRAEFLALQTGGGGESGTAQNQITTPGSGGNRVRIFVPTAAFSGTDESETEVSIWKVDASGTHVAPQMITLGREKREDHRLVVSGLKPGDRVVLNPPSDLKERERFRGGESSHSNKTSTTPES